MKSSSIENLLRRVQLRAELEELAHEPEQPPHLAHRAIALRLQPLELGGLLARALLCVQAVDLGLDGLLHVHGGADRARPRHQTVRHLVDDRAVSEAQLPDVLGHLAALGPVVVGQLVSRSHVASAHVRQRAAVVHLADGPVRVPELDELRVALGVGWLGGRRADSPLSAAASRCPRAWLTS